jgi:hypothetical protein
MNVLAWLKLNSKRVSMSSALCVINSSVVINFNEQGVQLTQYVDVGDRKDEDGKTSDVSYDRLAHEFFDSAIICEHGTNTAKALKERTLKIDPLGYDAQCMQKEIDAIKVFAESLESLLDKGKANFLAKDI